MTMPGMTACPNGDPEERDLQCRTNDSGEVVWVLHYRRPDGVVRKEERHDLYELKREKERVLEAGCSTLIRCCEKT